MFRYWIKIQKLENNTIVKSVYNMIKFDAEQGHTFDNQNWASQIKSMLEKKGDKRKVQRVPQSQ